MWICEVLYKGNDLRLKICAFYLWQMALNIGHDASFEKKLTGKEYRKAHEQLMGAPR
jgi:hypothetical protein